MDLIAVPPCRANLLKLFKSGNGHLIIAWEITVIPANVSPQAKDMFKSDSVAVKERIKGM